MVSARKAIVIGGNHHNTLGVIRSLGRKGLIPYVIITSGGKDSFVLKSKYICNSWAVNGSEAAIEFLLSHFSNEVEKPVIIACHDVISSLLDLNRNILSSRYILPGCDEQGQLTTLMNKKTMGEIAIANQMNTPNTTILTGWDDPNIELITYPCITKPVESRKGSKSEIHVCHVKDQLLDIIKSQRHNLLVQQYVEKEMEFQLIGCSIGFGEEIIIPGVSIILRQPLVTNTGFLHYRNADSSYDKTIENTKRFIRSVGYSGLFSVEFLRDKQGTDFFMEINFRNDGNAISVTNAGVNLPYIWYLSCCGADYSHEIQPIHDEFVMPEFDEIALFSSRVINRRQWNDDMKKATSFMDYASDDPAPTDGWKKYNRARLKGYIKRFLKKFMR